MPDEKTESAPAADATAVPESPSPVKLYDPSGEVIHLDKFMQGRMTPMEAHVKYAWSGRRCAVCNGAPVIRIAIFMPLAEAMRRAFSAVMKAAELNGGDIPSCEMSDGKRYVKASDAVFCSGCRKTALHEAAEGVRKWSACIVDVDEGPDEKRGPFSMVPRNYRGSRGA